MERRERADAARNRETVLAAAAALLDAAADPGQVSMADIAAAAGVGKGTLFRGFGDRTGLLQALAAQRSERLLAEQTAAGPGADPLDRVTAKLHAILHFKLANRALMLALEGAGHGSPYDGPTYERWHADLTALLSESRGPQNAGFLAHALLSAVRSDLIEHLRSEPPAELEAGVAALAEAVLQSGTSRRKAA